MKTALIVVDVQKFFHDFPLLKNSVDLALFSINSALQFFRQVSNPVFFGQHTDDSYLPEGCSGFELSDAIDRKSNEQQIVKRFPNSFYQTDLAEKLRKEQVGLVVICGLSASKCIMATIQGALENGFKAAFLQHAVADIKESLVLTPYEVCPVVSVDVLKYYMSA